MHDRSTGRSSTPGGFPLLNVICSSADFALWPFVRQLVKRADAGVPSTVGNIIWIIFGVVACARAHHNDHRAGGDDDRRRW
jgi:hypothetical protein